MDRNILTVQVGYAFDWHCEPQGKECVLCVGRVIQDEMIILSDSRACINAHCPLCKQEYYYQDNFGWGYAEKEETYWLMPF